MRAFLSGLILAATALTAGGAAVAQPALYRVVNIDSTDVLNVRRTPSPTSAIVGALPPGAERVEVLETRHGWGRILMRRGEGWVSLAYLAETERAAIEGHAAPGGFSCAGTEPFWGLDIGVDGTGAFNDAMTVGEEREFRIEDARTARGRFYPYVYHFDGEASGFAVIAPQACSDGMSERGYGWHVVADIGDGEGRRLLDGCCWTPVAE